VKICIVGLELGTTKEGVFIGGGVNHAKQLCKMLSKQGNEVCVITTYPRQHTIAGNLRVDWAEIHPISARVAYPSLAYGLEFTMKALIKLIRLHKQTHFQVISGYSGSPLVALIVGIAGKLLRIPSIFSVTYPRMREKQNRPSLLSRLSSLCYSQMTAIIGVSEIVKSSLIKNGIPARKITVIPPAVDIETFNPSVSTRELRKGLGIDENDPVILFVGDLSQRKGTDVALQALSEVVRVYPKTKLIMTSELPDKTFDERERDVKAAINSLRLQDNIIRLGIIKNMAETIAASDIFIAPFRTTRGILDYPMPILEAMATGKPVIASKVGGIPEVISDMETGILVEPGDALSLSKAILVLCEDGNLRQKLGSNATKYISEKLHPERVVRETEKVYKETIALRNNG